MVLQILVDGGQVGLQASNRYCPPFSKPRNVPGDVDGGDFLWVEEGGVAELEEALQVGGIVLVRALGGGGVEHDRCCFS